MQFSLLTLFPESAEPYLKASVLGRGKEAGVIDFDLLNIRDFAEDKHSTVDDTPYGGGPGMVLKVEPIAKALESLNPPPNPLPYQGGGNNVVTPPDKVRQGGVSRVVVLSARGKQFTQAKAEEYSKLDHLVLIAGRYEGIDQRVVDHFAEEEISVGPYVLAGGELPALTIIEATARLIPGVLGNEESLREESHNDEGLKEAPQYTKPEDFNGLKVPEILLSGDHAKIEEWRNQNRKGTV